MGVDAVEVAENVDDPRAQVVGGAKQALRRAEVTSLGSQAGQRILGEHFDFNVVCTLCVLEHRLQLRGGACAAGCGGE